jgi:hypothetical protein
VSATPIDVHDDAESVVIDACAEHSAALAGILQRVVAVIEIQLLRVHIAAPQRI